MASPISPAVLKRVQGSDVKQWFRDAWRHQDRYPDGPRCHQVALQVNTIVDRHNALPKRGAAEAAIRKRRQDHLIVMGRARAFNRALQCTMDNLRREQNISTVEGLAPINGDLAHHISVTAQALTAVENFLGLPGPSKFQDHTDPILWIATAAEEAWWDTSPDTADGQKKSRFSRKPDGPLVWFTRLALDAIGLASDDQPGNSLDTISDHLRERHNRPRPRRGANAGVGEK